MNRRLALKAWFLPVAWNAHDDPPAITATVVPAVPVVHHLHVHLAPGMTLADLVTALPQQRGVIEVTPQGEAP